MLTLPEIFAGYNLAKVVKQDTKGVSKWFKPRNNESKPLLENQALNDALGAIHKEVICRINRPNANLTDIANGCRDSIAILLNADNSDIHCAIKHFDQNDFIYAIGRSDGKPNRLAEDQMGLNNKCHITDNSGFSAILGKVDKSQKDWKKLGPFPCFIGNNLTQKPYHCSRPDWRDHYQSVAVFPISTPFDSGSFPNAFRAKGFLTFDSKDPKIFSSLPDLFDNLDKVEQYIRKLNASPVFHMANIISHVLYHGIQEGS